jgi:predicted DNA-binding ribbon-helix-helix protein
MRKHSVSIQGHRTSISLEDIFWDALKRAAHEEQKPLAALIADVDTARGSGLASALRVWLYTRALERTHG